MSDDKIAKIDNTVSQLVEFDFFVFLVTREYLEDTLKLEETESRSQEVKKHSHEIDHNDTTYNNNNNNNAKYISQ